MLTAPAVETAFASEEGEDVGEDGREAAGEDREDPEAGKPLANLEAGVPTGD